MRSERRIRASGCRVFPQSPVVEHASGEVGIVVVSAFGEDKHADFVTSNNIFVYV